MTKQIQKILNNPELSIERKISKLQILALKAFPSSPNQKEAQTAYRALQESLKG